MGASFLDTVALGVLQHGYQLPQNAVDGPAYLDPCRSRRKLRGRLDEHAAEQDQVVNYEDARTNHLRLEGIFVCRPIAS